MTTPQEPQKGMMEEIVNLKEWHELQSVLDAIWQSRPIHIPDMDLLERLAVSIHHQLQKAREEERERIVKITTTARDAFMVPATEQRWLQAIQAELDQDKQ